MTAKIRVRAIKEGQWPDGSWGRPGGDFEEATIDLSKFSPRWMQKIGADETAPDDAPAKAEPEKVKAAGKGKAKAEPAPAPEPDKATVGDLNDA